MGISLSKGQGVSLSKEAPNLSRIMVGLGWDERQTDGAAYDLDASVFLVGEDSKVYEQPGIVGYMAPQGANGSVVYGGDNRTGEGEGDDETIDIDLNALPESIKKVVVTVTIHDAEKLNQNFGGIENSFVRIVNKDGEAELCKYDLREDFDIETAMIMGEVYRHNGEWKFRAIGQGFANGLKGLCDMFGVQVTG